MFYHPDPDPFMCVIALDDMRLINATRQQPTTQWEHAYLAYSIAEANHRGFFIVTPKSINVPHYIISPILYPPRYFYTAFARGDAHTAWRMYLRCCWHNNPPTFTRRLPPIWADDSQPAHTFISSDRTLLAYRARAMIAFAAANSHGVIHCPRCNNYLPWSCASVDNHVSFACEDCIQLHEEPK